MIFSFLLYSVVSYNILGYEPNTSIPILSSNHTQFCTSITQKNCTVRKPYNFCTGSTCVTCNKNPMGFTSLYIQNSLMNIIVSNTCSPPFKEGSVYWPYPLILGGTTLTCASGSSCVIYGKCPLLYLLSDVVVTGITFNCTNITDGDVAAIILKGPKNTLNNVASNGLAVFKAYEGTNIENFNAKDITSTSMTGGILTNTIGDFTITCSIPVAIYFQLFTGNANIQGCSSYNMNSHFLVGPNIHMERDEALLYNNISALFDINNAYTIFGIILLIALVVYVIRTEDLRYGMMELYNDYRKKQYK